MRTLKSSRITFSIILAVEVAEMKRIEIVLEDEVASRLMAKMKEEGFVKNNGSPAFSQALKYLIRNFLYTEL